MQYMSPEWKAAQWAAFEEQYIGDDDSDCGWGPDGPCGGCSRCMRGQFGHGLDLEEQKVRTLQRAGMLVADQSLVQLGYFPGFQGYHSFYDCKGKEELPNWAREFPWEPRKGGRL